MYVECICTDVRLARHMYVGAVLSGPPIEKLVRSMLAVSRAPSGTRVPRPRIRHCCGSGWGVVLVVVVVVLVVVADKKVHFPCPGRRRMV